MALSLTNHRQDVCRFFANSSIQPQRRRCSKTIQRNFSSGPCLGEDPGDHGSVALEQRLQGEPGLQDTPGGAAPLWLSLLFLDISHPSCYIFIMKICYIRIVQANVPASL